jgi:CheY-like chemotaxis protein
MSKIDKLFLVDDDEIFTMLFSLSLQKNESVKSMEVFCNGKEAINHIEGNADNPIMLPDVIFLDLNMPIMDGWQFLDRYESILPKLAKQIDVYVLSSSIFPEDVSRAKSFDSVIEYLIKPIANEKLTEIVANHKS